MDEKGNMSNRIWIKLKVGKKVNIKIQIEADENGHRTPNMLKAELRY